MVERKEVGERVRAAPWPFDGHRAVLAVHIEHHITILSSVWPFDAMDGVVGNVVTLAVREARITNGEIVRRGNLGVIRVHVDECGIPLDRSILVERNKVHLLLWLIKEHDGKSALISKRKAAALTLLKVGDLCHVAFGVQGSDVDRAFLICPAGNGRHLGDGLEVHGLVHKLTLAPDAPVAITHSNLLGKLEAFLAQMLVKTFTAARIDLDVRDLLGKDLVRDECFFVRNAPFILRLDGIHSKNIVTF
mmetsp:Transcript_41505/g.97341  ORF Transcript_41505/g.97341 Transcript_41505/m.97341 type:complete len:248 (+) Transcript_41505:1154-1897(+)